MHLIYMTEWLLPRNYSFGAGEHFYNIKVHKRLSARTNNGKFFFLFPSRIHDVHETETRLYRYVYIAFICTNIIYRVIVIQIITRSISLPGNFYVSYFLAISQVKVVHSFTISRWSRRYVLLMSVNKNNTIRIKRLNFSIITSRFNF